MNTVRTVEIPGLGRQASVVGFGCASLGSRIGAEPGLRALADAHAHGVNWFDLAPAYGAGEAEEIFGRFLAGRRDRVLVCSKVGLAPPQRNGLLKLAYRIARPIAGMAQGLRKAFRRVPSTRNVSLPLTPDLIRTSLERSLTSLRTDHLDVFALHKPNHVDIARDDVLRTLQEVQQAGKVRLLAVSGDAEAGRIALGCGGVYGMVQLADDPVASPLAALRAAGGQGRLIVTHSVLGVGGNLERLTAALRSPPPALHEQLRAAGYPSDPQAAASLLLVDRALAANREGVVLLSMFGDRHRAANLARATQLPQTQAVELVARLLAQPDGAASR